MGFSYAYIQMIFAAENMKHFNLNTNTMERKNLVQAGLLTLLVVAAFVISWEAFWKSKGFVPTFNDDKMLWAEHRKDVYKSADDATVFIGSSRIKFDLDIPTWKAATGEDAVQLSLVGTSPLLLLEDLAQDEKFNGKLIVDVTEPLFFSQNPMFSKSAREVLNFYKKQTPSEKVSSKINLALESKLTFLEEKRFSLTSLLADLEVPNRPGVFSFPVFPKTFEWNTRDRQNYMSDMFLSDTNSINKQTNIWKMLIMGDKTPPISDSALKTVFAQVKTNVDRIRSRGGKVMFTRTPSSGFMGEGEKMFFSREKFWNPMLSYAKADGIHFLDYAETKDLVCPEWSHLSRDQAKFYTHQLVRVLEEKGWFSNLMAIR
jgi:hypothetical protein